MTDRKLLERALEALEGLAGTSWTAAFKQREYNSDDPNENVERERVLGVITALRDRLAQPQRTHWEGCEEVHPECRKPEQEPVAWLYRDYYNTLKLAQTEPPPPLAFPVYTTPPCREWVGLTEEDVVELWNQKVWNEGQLSEAVRFYASAIEAKLKEKNA